MKNITRSEQITIQKYLSAQGTHDPDSLKVTYDLNVKAVHIETGKVQTLGTLSEVLKRAEHKT